MDFAEAVYAPSFSSSFRNSVSDRFLSNIFCTALYRSSVDMNSTAFRVVLSEHISTMLIKRVIYPLKHSSVFRRCVR